MEYNFLGSRRNSIRDDITRQNEEPPVPSRDSNLKGERVLIFICYPVDVPSNNILELTHSNLNIIRISIIEFNKVRIKDKLFFRNQVRQFSKDVHTKRC